MSTAAEELAAQAEQLKSLISVFDLGNNEELEFSNSPTVEVKMPESTEQNKIENKKNSGFNINLPDDEKLDDDYENY